MNKPKVAVLRPDDERIVEAIQYLKSLGVMPVPDPMLTIHPTGNMPCQADYCIFTSKTGVELVATHGWKAKETILCAVGQRTASTLQDHGYSVDIVPPKFTSSGLVKKLSNEVAGQSIEIARSAHGSEVLIRGLKEAGAFVHETHLYRLGKPSTAGRSVGLAADGQLDGILFTSPKTVDHLFEIACEKGRDAALQRELDRILVGVIGTPTECAVRERGVSIDIKPNKVDFELLSREMADRILEL